ncbi:carboxypeptidase-like regulatory domain-containing protein [Candidatus Electrothrix sp.]|uniref:carboxypeptidase-like regulatory domain-containing protein n=1 Tax=Candidatus Electrothrix sp. TaxID=2170559 RepID=UPI0040576C45
MNKYLFSLLVIVLSASTVSAASLEGTVRDPSTALQPEFVVTLTPPKKSNKPKEVTSTSSTGNYLLDNIDKGKYMFEVSYGTEVIYRKVIEVQGDDTKDVTLQRQ